MPPESGKNLFIAYCLVFLGLLVSLSIWDFWPVRFVKSIHDPVLAFLVAIVFLGFAPGVLVGYFAVLLSAAAVLFALLIVLMPLWLLLLLARTSTFGAILSVPLFVAMVIAARFWWQKNNHKILAEVAGPLRTMVEFAAWVQFVVTKITGGVRSRTSGWAKEAPKTWGAKEAPVEEKKGLQLVRKEMIELQYRFPELPMPPRSYFQNEYEGWFAEAKKRFEMQSFNRTQAERIEVRKKVAELNGLFLVIARQEGEMLTFEQEQRIRQKNMNIQELELDYKMEDLQYEREQKLEARRRPKETAKPKEQDIEGELKAKFSKVLRTKRAVLEFFTNARAEHPDLTEMLNEWENEVLFDFKENKWF